MQSKEYISSIRLEEGDNIELTNRSPKSKPLVTVITPAYNESAILKNNIEKLSEYMGTLEEEFDWEILIVNDGSKDDTGKIADEIVAYSPHNIRVIHHQTNKNLGGAMRTGFIEARGEYVVVLDIDLSYEPSHIERLLAKAKETDADIVIASPYMKGGKSTKVPLSRLLLSRVVNRFMRATANADLHTFTSMVRVYKGGFLKHLNLKSNTYAIMPEIIHKALILRAKVVEIPAHLDWSFQAEVGATRTSSMRIFKGILSGLMSGFIFRPYAFFMLVGLGLLIVSLWLIMWIFIHTFSIFPLIEVPSGFINDRFSEAVAIVFKSRPHAFFVGGISFIAALQFLGIGFLSLQNKRYFDELFHINTTLFKELLSLKKGENSN